MGQFMPERKHARNCGFVGGQAALSYQSSAFSPKYQITAAESALDEGLRRGFVVEYVELAENWWLTAESSLGCHKIQGPPDIGFQLFARHNGVQHPVL